MPPGAFLVFFFGGHLPQTSDFRSAKQILVVSFATQARAFILSDRNIFNTPRGGEQRRGLMPLGLFLFFGGHLPQTSGFRSVKQILVVSFATQARAFILSDRNIFYAPGGGREQRRGLMPLGLFFLFFFCRGHLPQTSARSKQYLRVIFVRLLFIRQNFHERWCRKLLAI